MNVFFAGAVFGAVIGVMIAHAHYRRLWKREIAWLKTLVRDMGRIVSSPRNEGDKVLNLEEDYQEQQGVSS